MRAFETLARGGILMGVTTTEPLPSFRTLRAVADNSKTARACIDLRKSEIRAIEADITGGDKGQRPAARTFFAHPDWRYPTFHAWLDALLEDLFVVDAVAIYLHPSQESGKGAFGTDIVGLDLMDPATVCPVVTREDFWGTKWPTAFTISMFGDVPRGGADVLHPYMAACAKRDPSGDPAGGLYGVPDGRVIYRSRRRHGGTPFGCSPVEEALVLTDDGAIDYAATDARLPAAFRIDLDDPGKDAERRVRPLLAWLKGIFDGILHDHLQRPDLQWVWEAAP